MSLVLTLYSISHYLACEYICKCLQNGKSCSLSLTLVWRNFLIGAIALLFQEEKERNIKCEPTACQSCLLFGVTKTLCKVLQKITSVNSTNSIILGSLDGSSKYNEYLASRKYKWQSHLRFIFLCASYMSKHSGNESKEKGKVIKWFLVYWRVNQ